MHTADNQFGKVTKHTACHCIGSLCSASLHGSYPRIPGCTITKVGLKQYHSSRTVHRNSRTKSLIHSKPWSRVRIICLGHHSRICESYNTTIEGCKGTDIRQCHR